MPVTTYQRGGRSVSCSMHLNIPIFSRSGPIQTYVYCISRPLGVSLFKPEILHMMTDATAWSKLPSSLEDARFVCSSTEVTSH